MKHKPNNDTMRPCIECLHKLAFGCKAIRAKTRASNRFIWVTTKALPQVGNKKQIRDRRKIKVGTKAEARAAREAFKVNLRNCISLSRKHFALELANRRKQETPEERRKRQNAYWHFKYRTDPQTVMKTRLRKRMRKILGERKAGRRSEDIIGCTIAEFMRHIESQFKEGMDWDNRGLWHIDHIVPCSAFNLLDEEQVRICFNYKNMRPLWAKENLAKSDKLEQPVQHRFWL